MNKRFFNQQNLTRRLRLLPVLFAMLLMPLSAWADSYFGINTSSGNTYVTDENAANIWGDGTMSYDIDNKILTLNGIDLTSTSNYFSDAFIAMVDNSKTLTIRLLGTNSVSLGDKASFFNGTSITFTTDTSNPGTLTINTVGSNNTGEDWGGVLFLNYQTSQSMNATYNNGLGLTHSGNTYTIQTLVNYNITVAGTAVTSANASNVLNDDYSSVSYNASTNTLTLKGVHLNSANNGISVPSDLNINLVGYSDVGTINVTSGTLNFTTSATLPGCLKTNIAGNSTITYGAGTGLSWDGTMVKSSNTNPYIIYATGYKGNGDEYWNDNGDIMGYSTEGDVANLDVSTDVTVVNSLNNASIDYFKVSSNSDDPKSCYIYPGSLDDMNLVTKAYFLFDWGTCTNKNVKVQVRGMNSNYGNDGNYSEEVSLPSTGGLVEIPLTQAVNSYYFQIYFSSSTGEFSFIPISVGFQKTESYGLTVGGVQVTSENAANIFDQDYATASYDNASNTLTLKGVHYDDQTSSFVSIGGSLESLTVHLVGYNQVGYDAGKLFSSTNACIVNFTTDATVPGKLVYYGESTNMTDNVTLNFGTSGLAPDGTTIEAVSGTSDICYFGIGQFYDDDPNSDYPYCAYTNSIIWYFSNAAITNGNNSYPPTVNSSAGTTGYVSRMKTSGSAIIKSLTFQYVPVSGGTINVALTSLDGGTTYATGTLANGLVTLPPNTEVNYQDVCLTFTSESAFSFVPMAIKTIEPESYGITVAGVQVTELNASGITGTGITGTVTFTPASDSTPAILTLEDASIVPTVDDSGISYIGAENLTIKLKGSNEIQGVGNSAISYGGDNDSKLIFTKEGTQPCSLQLASTNYTVISGFNAIQGVNGIDGATGNALTLISNDAVFYDSENGLNTLDEEGEHVGVTSAVIAESYDLTVSGVSVTSANASAIQTDAEFITVEDGGSVTFDAATSTLTLNKAHLKHGIVSGLESLKIRFQGTNKINSDSQVDYIDTQEAAQNNAISSSLATATLTFEKTGDGTIELYAKTSLYYPVISGFASVSYGSGDNQCYVQSSVPSHYDGTGRYLANFYDVKGVTNATITSVVSYPLWIGSGNFIQVTSANSDGITGTAIESGNVSFVASDNKLKLKNAAITSKILSGLTSLTIDVEGSCSVIIPDSGSVVRSAVAGALTITKTGTNASLTLKNVVQDSYYPVIQRFSSLTYTDFNLDTETSATYGQFGLGMNGGNAQIFNMYGLYNPDETESYKKGITSAIFTTATLYPLWVAGVHVTSDNASNITGTNIQGGKVSYDAETHMLTLNGASLFTNENNPEPMITCNGDLTIQLIGDNSIVFSGDYSNYAIKNTATSGTLTITQSGTDAALNITTEKNESDSKGLCDGFTAVNFANGLAYTVRNGSRAISTLDLASPEYTVNENELSFSLSKGLLYGTSNGAIVAAEYFYKITYADASIEGSGVEHELTSNFSNFNIDPTQKIAVNSLAGTCTIETYTKLNGETSTANKAKKFGPSESPMRLVYGADPVDLVLAPTIEESDGIKINDIEANVTYNATTGKVSSSTLGSHGAIVALTYTGETVKTILLNNYFNMDFDVVPPAPTIGLAEGAYHSTQEAITITSDGLANTTIKYKWDDDDEADYPATGVPFQAGTLKAWVVYTSGETSLSSDIVSATYTVLSEAGLQYVVGDDPVEENVDYVMGGTGSEVTLPTLLNPHNVSVTYESGNTAIATVAADGTVTPVGVGSTTITAKSTATTEYAASEASYWLNVYKSLSHSSITVEISAVTYNGQAQTPTVIVKDGDDVLPYGEDDGYDNLIYAYKVEFANNTNAALATAETNAPTATITALTDGSVSHMEVNWYRGSTTKTFTINKAQLTVKADDKTYNVGDDIELTVSYDGFVNGETKTVLTTQPTASYGTADVSKPGSYTITASGGEAANYDFVYQPGTLTINRQLTVSFSTLNEWATYYGTDNLATPEGLKAYQVTAVEGATVTISEIGYIPANTAVLLQNVSINNTWTNIAASAYTGATSTFENNKLIGTASAVDVSTITGGTVYVLYNNMFKRATGGTIPANRGYLVVEPSAVNAGNAPQLSITIGDETTSIDNGQLTIDNYVDEWFTLDGQKLQQAPTRKGLYIKNGKKVVINKK